MAGYPTPIFDTIIVNESISVSGNLSTTAVQVALNGGNSWEPAFGGDLHVWDQGANLGNAIVGSVRNTGTNAIFPTGITGYGRLDGAGSAVFGIFGRVDLYTNGVAVNELDSFNYSGAFSGTLPPNMGFGTTDNVSIGLQLVAYGSYDSAIGLNIAFGGGGQQFYAGIYMQPQACAHFGIFIDNDGTHGPPIPLWINGLDTNGAFVTLKNLSGAGSENAVLQVLNSTGAVTAAIKSNGRFAYGAGNTSATAVAGSASLPTNPVGFIDFEVSGTVYHIPYYG